MVSVDWLVSGEIVYLVVFIDRRSERFLYFVFDSRRELQRKPLEKSKVFSTPYSRKQSANQQYNTSGPHFSTKTKAKRKKKHICSYLQNLSICASLNVHSQIHGYQCSRVIKLTSIYNYQYDIKEIKDNCFTACTSSHRRSMHKH